MSVVPAHIARLPDQGRPLAVGSPGNVVLVDPTRRAVVDRTESASRSRNNPWHGRELPDPVVATVWAGRVTYRR
jgi:dihydroorotase